MTGEEVARELYRQLYPGPINTPDRQRTPESDVAEHERAYDIWDAGAEGWSPGIQCRHIADALVAMLPND